VSRNAAEIVTTYRETFLSATRLEAAAEDSEGDMADLSARLRARFGLTPAEIRVAVVLAEGLSYAEIAKRLSISVHTVHTHVKEIHQKLEVPTNGRAAAIIRRLEYQK
jgi:DNA-binding CsgD family transcriptional regulator